MKQYDIEVKPMSDFKEDISRDVAAVFVDGYEQYLTFLSKDREKIIKAFQKMICNDVFYCASINGEIVGIMACSNNKNRAIQIDKQILRSAFGFMKGSLAYLFMKDAFSKKLPYEDDTSYIECVATMAKARGKGAATALMKFVLENAPYRRYLLEVTDTNEVAYRIYKKLGFTEFERKKERFKKLKGFNYRIYKEYINE